MRDRMFFTFRLSDCFVVTLRWMVAVVALLATTPVRAALPDIIGSPTSQTVHAGEDAVFRVVVEGAESVRWFLNGAEQTGASGDAFTIAEASLAQDGARVLCIVTNETGSRNCDEAKLKVLRPTREMITFTGELSDLQGITRPEDGAIDMVVELYQTETGGASLYREVFLVSEGRGVPVQTGRFLVRLGSGRVVDGVLSDALQNTGSVYVQFHLGNLEAKETLEPRIPLTAVPFAVSAASGRIRGSGSPVSLGVDAPVGTQYQDTKDQSIWIRSFKSWIKVP